jgi:hypothetical protein
MFHANNNLVTASSIARSFGDPQLKVPFSCRATIGYVSRMRTDPAGRVRDMPANNITVGPIQWPLSNGVAYQLSLERDLTLTGLYIDVMAFEWFPVGNENFVNPFSGERYNGRFVFRQAGQGVPYSYVVNFHHPALYSARDEIRKVAFNISADYTVTAYVAGEKVFETDAIIQWRRNNNYNGDMHVTHWHIFIPNSDNGIVDTAPAFYLNNTIATNSGTIYTGAASELPNP